MIKKELGTNINHQELQGSRTNLILPPNHEPFALRRVENPPSGYFLYTAEVCSSSMDLAWYLHEMNLFPERAAVVVNYQKKGRGQFGRAWVSPAGNLYASLHLPSEPFRSWPLTSFFLAFCIQKALINLGVSSEFKWPNDILVCRRKAGGILLEERSGVLIAGIGINLTEAPSMSVLRDEWAVPGTHLKEFGLSVSPLELWEIITRVITDQILVFSDHMNCNLLLRTLESHMAYLGEKVVFKTRNANEIPAVVTGLSESGGIRLKTMDGEKILHSGSFFPVVS